MHRPRGSRIADLGSQHHLLICHTGHGTKPTAAIFLQGFSLHHTSPKEQRVSLAPSSQYEWHFLKPHPLPYPTLGPGRRETRTLTSDFSLFPLSSQTGRASFVYCSLHHIFLPPEGSKTLGSAYRGRTGIFWTLQEETEWSEPTGPYSW